MKTHYCQSCNKEYACTLGDRCEMPRETPDCGTCWRPFKGAFSTEKQGSHTTNPLPPSLLVEL